MPVTVPCARLLTDAPLRSHNTLAKLLLLLEPHPCPIFRWGKWRLRGVRSLRELYLNPGQTVSTLSCYSFERSLGQSRVRWAGLKTSFKEMLIVVQQNIDPRPDSERRTEMERL